MPEPNAAIQWEDERSPFASLYATEPSAKGPADALSPAGARVTSERAPAETPAPADADRLAAIARIQATPEYKAGDPATLQKLQALVFGDRPTPPDALPPETEPRVLTDADLPPLRPPSGVPDDDEELTAFRAVAAHAGLPAETAQRIVDRVDYLLRQPIPDTYDEQEAHTARQLAAIRRKHGAAYADLEDRRQQALALLGGERPQWRAVAQHLHIASDPELFDLLAEVGIRARQFYASKVGTSRAVRF